MKEYLEKRIKKLWICHQRYVCQSNEKSRTELEVNILRSRFAKIKYVLEELDDLLLACNEMDNKNTDPQNSKTIIDFHKIYKMLPPGSVVTYSILPASDFDSMHKVMDFEIPEKSLSDEAVYLLLYDIKLYLGKTLVAYGMNEMSNKWRAWMRGDSVEFINSYPSYYNRKMLEIKEKENKLHPKKITKQKAINTKKKVSLK